MNSREVSNLTGSLKSCLLKNNEYANIASSERLISVATGSFILFKGLSNTFSHPLWALSEALIGAGLLYRGVTGYCPVKGVMENEFEEIEPLTYVDHVSGKTL